VTESRGGVATAVIEADVREGTYGSKVAAVEPGGAEFIPLSERHGTPLGQFWTWVSPNMEFATIFVGVIGVWFFGQSFWMAALAILLGSALGSVSMGALAARGPLFGVPQMVLSRISFGYLGNILPAGVNALVAGVGWFAVNSVSGAFALNALLGWNSKICLVIIVVVQLAVAFFGHNLVHMFERIAFPLLVVVFAIAAVVTFTKAHPGGVHETGGLGGWLITLGAAFGYAAGWNPYASDYTRYLPRDTNRRATGLWAGLGVFVSCLVLEVVGAAAATVTSVAKYADNPTAGFTSHLPTAVADITLLLLLGASRRAYEALHVIHSGNWNPLDLTLLLGWQITGKILGIYGMGRIGQAVAKRARGFGMKIHYHDPHRLSPEIEGDAVFHDNPYDLLRVSPFLSLNAPETKQTHHFLDAKAIACLPRGAIVVNPARGGMVVDEDLIAALKSGQVAAAGLDTYEGEPKLNPGYLSLKNTFLLPHIGAATIETRTAMGMLALDNIDAILGGRLAPSLVT